MSAAELNAVFERNYTLVEPYTLLMKAQVRSIFDRLLEVRALPGDTIEFGAFRGGLSCFLGLCIRDLGLRKQVYMLDSFQGLPDARAELDGPFERGMMAGDVGQVSQLRSSLGLDGIVQILPGWFEETLPRLPDSARFCLAHLDADLYSSTRTALQYLALRLVDGGAVVLDDCVCHDVAGVIQATEEVLGGDVHLHLGPKTQAFVFPRGDPRRDRGVPVWRPLGGRRYDLADLLARADYLELVAWEEAFYREHARWYSDYLQLLSGRADPPEDSHRITLDIGAIRRR